MKVGRWNIIHLIEKMIDLFALNFDFQKKKNTMSKIFVSLMSSLFVASGTADVGPFRFSQMYKDHMVLQRAPYGAPTCTTQRFCESQPTNWGCFFYLDFWYWDFKLGCFLFLFLGLFFVCVCICGFIFLDLGMGSSGSNCHGFNRGKFK